MRQEDGSVVFQVGTHDHYYAMPVPQETWPEFTAQHIRLFVEAQHRALAYEKRCQAMELALKGMRAQARAQNARGRSVEREAVVPARKRSR